ncbi:MAG: ATP-binding protein [Oscillospiraceae bacterium]|nr:ATP-binding protein [Oscillospiraceae bacterium]
MAVFTMESARDNIRVKDGRRVFYLADGDHLTPSARDWLEKEKIPVLPASEAKPKQYRALDGGIFPEKPEHMTHLRADTLVRKDHPRIAFRGMVDHLEAQLLLTIVQAQGTLKWELEEILAAVRSMIRCDVLEEPLHLDTLCGMSMAQIREHSHFPQKYYDQPHFMPSAQDSSLLLQLNLVRTLIRRTELAAYEAFHDREGIVTRQDILQLLNRLSSMVWILMIRLKKEERHGTEA